MQSRYAACVPKNVQIRNLDDATYETLRRRAASEGMSLAQYLRRELNHLAATPTMAEWMAGVDSRRHRFAQLDPDAVEAAFAADRAERR